MTAFIPLTDADKTQMLDAIGVLNMEDLFADVPLAKRYPLIDLPKGISEAEALSNAKKIAKKNKTADDYEWFLGAGTYNHYVPAVVSAVLSRGEFLTAYTPYQPEVSQGTLQAIFEYQTIMAEILGVDAVNASHYDGATALAEAAIMCVRQAKNPQKVLLDGYVNPDYIEVLKTYLSGYEVTVEKVQAQNLKKSLDETAACYIMAFPNFLGELTDIKAAAEQAHSFKIPLIVSVNPMALGIFEAPGLLGADIVVGEGQVFGSNMNFGGPHLGIFGVKGKFLRKMPGRIVGQTVDNKGKKGCVLTLAAREQHIRREKATSNICSNQGLQMLACAVYLSAVGKSGFRELAKTNYNKAHYAAEQIAMIKGFEIKNKEFFNEFTVHCPILADKIVQILKQRGVMAGLPLSQKYQGKEKDLLVCVTEKNSKESIDKLVKALAEV